MLDWQDEGLRAFVPDYGFNLLSPVAMKQEQTEKFRSDFRLLADFIHCARDKAELHRLMENEAYRHLDPLTADVANAVTNSNIKLEANERGEIDMCVAIDEIRKDERAAGIELGIEKGIEKGREEGKKAGIEEGRFESQLQAIKNLMHNVGFDAEKAMNAIGIPPEDFAKYQAKLTL